MARLNLLHLVGGGGDYACDACLPEAKAERDGEVVSVAKVDDPDAECGWCGVTASPTVAGALYPSLGDAVQSAAVSGYFTQSMDPDAAEDEAARLEGLRDEHDAQMRAMAEDQPA